LKHCRFFKGGSGRTGTGDCTSRTKRYELLSKMMGVEEAKSMEMCIRMPKAKSTGDINVTTYMDDSYNHPSLMTTQ
jgi:hypothetical protein